LADRIKPVEAAKRLGVPPQRVYNLIKQGRVKTFAPPAGGKVALVDFGEVKIVMSQVKQRGPKKERLAKGSRPPGGIRRGTILTNDRFPIKGAFRRPDGGGKSVRVVTDPGRGEGTLVWLSDGTVETFWGTESLAQKLQNKTAQIEDPAALLGMVVFNWRNSSHEEDRRVADRLEELLIGFEIPYQPIHIGMKPHDDEEEEEKPNAPVEVEVELTEEGIDVSKVFPPQGDQAVPVQG
jgi:hypothetical protein